MNIIFFNHPPFLGSQSMPRFANMLAEGMKGRGHSVEVWTAQPHLYNLSDRPFLKKWLGYLDQYLLFPKNVKKKIKELPERTLFVFTDHALGPWVALVKGRKHVIHCHDFLAQNSALGKIPENKTGISGRIYQTFIRKGYLKGKNFISVSNRTQSDLAQFLKTQPESSEVVYNGLNRNFKVHEVADSRLRLGSRCNLELSAGYILHVGGNQWYKNRKGVIEIYNAWRAISGQKLPLLLIGPKPNNELKDAYLSSPYSSDIHVFSGFEDDLVNVAYSGATVFLFPSLAEGFGWPIAEAMASGCPVITTNEDPMTEVAGDAAFLIPKRPLDGREVTKWSSIAAEIVNEAVYLDSVKRQAIIEKGLENVKRFDSGMAIDRIESIYENIVSANSKIDTSISLSVSKQT